MQGHERAECKSPLYMLAEVAAAAIAGSRQREARLRASLAAAIRGAGLTTRPLTTRDAEALSAWTTESHTRLFLGTSDPWTDDEAARWIKAMHRVAYKVTMLAVMVREELAGIVQGWEVNPDVLEFGILLAPHLRRRGIGSDVIRRVVDRGFSDGRSRIQAHVDPDNEPMKGVLEALGFTAGAVEPNWHGSGQHRQVYYILPGPRPTEEDAG